MPYPSIGQANGAQCVLQTKAGRRSKQASQPVQRDGGQLRLLTQPECETNERLPAACCGQFTLAPVLLFYLARMACSGSPQNYVAHSWGVTQVAGFSVTVAVKVFARSDVLLIHA